MLYKILVRVAGALYPLLCMVVSCAITFSVGWAFYDSFGHIVAAVVCAVLSIPSWIVAKRLRDSVSPGLRLLGLFVLYRFFRRLVGFAGNGGQHQQPGQQYDQHLFHGFFLLISFLCP